MSNMSLIRVWIILGFLLPAANAFEPYDTKRAPEEVRAFDHLRPINRAAPEFRYLAQYWVESVDEPPRYIVVVHDETARRYYVEQGAPPKCARILGKPYPFKKRVEISSETADLIYEFWLNVLLETHYDRKGLSAVDLGADICTFSTFVSNLGWLHGFKGESVGDDLPPDWISDAGRRYLTM